MAQREQTGPWEVQRQRLLELVAEMERQPRVTERILGGQLRQRQQLIRLIFREFMQRETAKERHLWQLVASALPEGPEYARQARRQWRDAEGMLVELRWFGDRDPVINEYVAKLLDCVRAALAWELEVFPQLRTACGDTTVDALIDRLEHASRGGPLRPHPDLLTTPWAVALLGRPLALADRVIEFVGFGPSSS